MPSRHHRVWLTAEWADHLCGPVDAVTMRAVDAWHGAGRPLVMARRQPGDPPGCLRLGLALPGRRRHSVAVRQAAMQRHLPPLTPAEAAQAAPSHWHAALDWLGGLGLPVGVYGSLAWQAVSGERYLSATSDLDVVFIPADRDQVEHLVRTLPLWDGAPRMDGEIMLPDGGAVAWREVLALPPRLMVKYPDRVMLQPSGAVLDQFPARRAA